MKRMRSGLCSLAGVAGLLLLCLPACSTLNTLTYGQKYLVGGTRENILAFVPRQSIDPLAGLRQVVAVVDLSFFLALPPAYTIDPYGGLRQTIAFFDFPFSLALDTILIPVTLPLQIIKGDKPP